MLILVMFADDPSSLAVHQRIDILRQRTGIPSSRNSESVLQQAAGYPGYDGRQSQLMANGYMATGVRGSQYNPPYEHYDHAGHPQEPKYHQEGTSYQDNYYPAGPVNGQDRPPQGYHHGASMNGQDRQPQGYHHAGSLNGQDGQPQGYHHAEPMNGHDRSPQGGEFPPERKVRATSAGSIEF